MTDKTKAKALEHVMMTRAKQTRNLSFVEFLANQELITNSLNKGYKAITVWQALAEEGFITFSYSTFTKYLRQLQSKQLNENTQTGGKNASKGYNEMKTGGTLDSTPPNVEGTHQAEPITLKLPEGMSHNPMINPKDLY
ncbi:MAG: hypothetical protein HOO92_17270 [Methylococcaceae bacterium]|nr:hypothetical protein [Methylococcaceae bacterium]